MELIEARIYDFPQYYDLLFGAEWRSEFNFLRACFGKHAQREVRRVFEPACGTGRLLFRLAKAGYEVSGNDLNPRAVDYCNSRLQRNGFEPRVRVGDMARFRLERKVDAAFNLINTFRHLSGEQEALGHLQAMARVLAKGGIYVLGFHLLPAGPLAESEECWTARRGRVGIESRMWSVGMDAAGRRERVAMSLDVSTPTRQFRLLEHMDFRTYTAQEFARLLGQVAELELVETYDFSYDIDRPAPINRRTEDAVYVLRRK